tara:strand:- start:467 stop:766 length:300 start_codon:yes stop_codon:yes gene_type:complete
MAKSKRPKKKNQQFQKQQAQVDLSRADSIQCGKCDNYLFIQSFVIKKISSIMSPTGKEAIVPVQVYSCGNCGEVPQMFLKGTGIENKPSDKDIFRPDLG